VSEHVDAETMSAFREDLLPGRQAARVAAHLATCEQCTELDAQLASVSAFLASAPAPPMPPALAARIEAALAAEAAARSATDKIAASPSIAATSATRQPSTAQAGAAQAPAPPATGPAADGSRGARRSRRRARSPGFPRLALRVGAAAATVVVVAGVGYGLVRLAAGSQSSPSSATGSSAGHAQASRPLLAKNPPLPEARAPDVRFPLVASGTDYQPGAIASQASAVLVRSSTRTSGLVPTSGTRASAFGGFDNVRACVRRVTGGITPRLVDVASYRGRPALAVMIPAGGATVRVLIVGADCSAGASDVLARATLPAKG
jgi:hypothetical protein